jgi:ABC-type polysaccharide/polyol phosphate export permease
VAYFIIILFLNRAYFTLWLFMTIPALLVFFMLGLAIAIIAATAQTYIRDYAPMQSLVLQGLFYVTPILYDFNMMKERGFNFVYEYNPFFYFIQILRDALMGQAPNSKLWLGALLILAVVLTFALWLFKRTRKHIAFKL